MNISITPLVGIDYGLAQPYSNTVTVAGLPVGIGLDASNIYATATFENVTITGSPLVAYFDPPVANVSDIDLPSLLLFLLAALANGAVISPF